MSMFASSIDFLTHQAKDITQANRHSIARIATGGDAQKLAAMDRKTGNLGKVIRISTDNMSKKDSISFFQNAISYMKFQEETILYARQLYSQMYALAQEAQADGLSQDEREMLNDKFLDLRQQAIDLNNLSFNGKSLFDQYAGSLKYDLDIKGSEKVGIPDPISRDFVYNRGILVFDISPGGGYDTFSLNQEIEKEDGTKEEKVLFKTRWNTAGSYVNGDFDRFFIEFGPGQDTTFRFIPLKEGSVQKRGLVDSDPATIDFDDPYYDNKARYIHNFKGSVIDEYGRGDNVYSQESTPHGTDGSVGDPDYWQDWGLDNFKDYQFADEYGHLVDQNPEESSNPQKSPENYSDETRSREVIFDKDAPTTIPLTGFKNSLTNVVYIETGKMDTSNTKVTFNHIPNIDKDGNPNYSSQVRYKFFSPESQDTDVGNIGDLETYLEPLGLGLLRDNEAKDFPILKLDSSSDAENAINFLKKEIDGLAEQMGVLGNNMARVVTSMDAVDKQLGIQKDLVAAEPEKVISQELANLAKAKEMRSFNASLMSRVVQMNHDMINMLLM